MKYSVKDYASAFAEAAAGKHSEAGQKKLIANFLEMVRRNGDRSKLQKIFAEADRLTREKEGLRKVVIETARPLDERLKKTLQGITQKGDIIEEKVAPELVAGVRVTVNDESQFDASLSRKLLRMFG